MAPHIAINTDIIKDVTLWARVDIPRFIRVTECELASAVISAVNSSADDELRLNPKDILGVQFMSSAQPCWIVNLASKQAKAMVLASDHIQLKGKSFKVSDYISPRPANRQKTKDIRLSIHGIPQNIPDAEVESWVNAFATIASPIFRHKSKDKGKNNEFEHLLTGHRFCYVTKIREDKDRYSSMPIPDPLDPKNLIDIEVVLYYNGQPETNCRYCHNSDHIISECPNKPVRKCYQCGQSDHMKYDCPHKDKGPKCFKCNCFGHRSYDCPDNGDNTPLDSYNSNVNLSNQSSTSPDDAETSHASEAAALAQELINHCLNPESDKSPELLEKVKSVLKLNSVNQKSSSKHKKSKKSKQSSQTNTGLSSPSSPIRKKKQTTLYESTKLKRKEISPNKDEQPDKRERKDSHVEEPRVEETSKLTRSESRGKTDGHTLKKTSKASHKK